MFLCFKDRLFLYNNKLFGMMLLQTTILILAVTGLISGCGNASRNRVDEMGNKNEAREKLLFDYADVAFDRLAKVGYDELDSIDKVFVCVWSLEGEVNNGGFDQYYFNTSGDWAFDTPNALLAIGATHTAAIVDRGNALFGDSGPSPDSATRQNQLDGLSESAQNQLNSLDDEFYRYTDDLSALLAAYLATHKTPEAK